MSDDIYDILLKEGALNREVDLYERKRLRKKNRNRLKVMKQILYEDISSDSDSDDYTLTANQMLNNSYIDLNINNNNEDIVSKLKKKYEIELNDYFYINSDNLDKMLVGGYIRYINVNEELKWGGILIKIIDKSKLTRMKLVLKNTNNNYWYMKFKNYFVFYKNNVSKYDKFKDLFITTAHLDF